jgi:hypothetical protein
MSIHLSFLIGSEVRDRGVFNSTVPTIIRQIVHFFETVHLMHDRALAILNGDGPYCLYLRRFLSAGIRFERTPSALKDTIVQTPRDQQMREFVSKQLGGALPVISCFNTLDLYTMVHTAATPDLLPGLRLLSHNWRRTMQALIDRAQFIVLFMTGFDDGKARDGVEFELTTIKQLDQHRRCIFVLDTERQDAQSAGFDVRAVFGWPAWAPDWDQIPDVGDFVTALKTLASDGHRRKKTLPPIQFPSCYVVDKDLTGQQVAAGQLGGIDYPHIIPDTLTGNLEAEQREYSRLLDRWGDIEMRLAEGRGASREELVDAMYHALACFALAATLEDYEPMARSIATVGLAHRLITSSTEIESLCLEGAIKFAGFAGLEELAQYFAAGLAKNIR